MAKIKAMIISYDPEADEIAMVDYKSLKVSLFGKLVWSIVKNCEGVYRSEILYKATERVIKHITDSGYNITNVTTGVTNGHCIMRFKYEGMSHMAIL